MADLQGFNVRAYGALVHKGQLLLAEESMPGFPVMIKLPGGGVDLGEGPGEALIRELKEEAFVDVQIDGLLHVSKAFIRSNFSPTQVIALYWKISLLRGEIPLDRVLTESVKPEGYWYRFFMADPLQYDLQNLSFMADREAVSILRQEIQT